jgi:hypothetical protein
MADWHTVFIHSILSHKAHLKAMRALANSMTTTNRGIAMPQACAKTRVIKKLSPQQSGALKLARQYGETLVCVRYRQSEDSLIRYTTVELVVESAPLIKRPSGDEILAVQLDHRERDLRQRIKSRGGQWDPQAHVWRLPRKLVRQLGLLKRVIDR